MIVDRLVCLTHNGVFVFEFVFNLNDILEEIRVKQGNIEVFIDIANSILSVFAANRHILLIRIRDIDKTLDQLLDATETMMTDSGIPCIDAEEL